MMKKVTVLSLAISGALALTPFATADFDANISTIWFAYEQVTFNNHEFGTTESGVDPDGLFRASEDFPIHVTTDASTLSGWDFQLEIDFTDYDIGFFGPNAAVSASIDILNTSYADVADAIALDANNNAIGSVSFTEDSLSLSSLTAQDVLDAGEIATIHWTIVPTPGAIALLGIAGLMGSRRRRN